jgi:hypothetical protein
MVDDPEVEQDLTQLETSDHVDPRKIKVLRDRALKLKDSAPHDALNIFRRLAMVIDKVRYAKDEEKLDFFSEASDLGWKLGELKWHFDLRTAQLQRLLGNLPVAGIYYERAAQSYIQEGIDSKITTVHDWKIQYEMLREARICHETSGYSRDASRCFIKGMKLRRDNSKTRLGKAKEWTLYLFWSWGESPLKVAIWGAVIIVFFSFGYYVTGLTGSSQNLYDFAETLYFSVVTFTTLGLGDIVPATRVGQFLAAIEALFGIFFTGLFLVTFVKRFSRR